MSESTVQTPSISVQNIPFSFLVTSFYVSMKENGISYYRVYKNKASSKLQSSDEDIIHEPVSPIDITNKVSLAQKRFYLWPISLILLLIPYAGPFLALLFSVCIYFFVDRYRKNVLLFYDIDPSCMPSVNSFYDAFEPILSSNKCWCILHKDYTNNLKHHGGAASAIKRKKIIIKFKSPKNIKTNVQIPVFPFSRHSLCFLPDRAIINGKKKVYDVPYDNLAVTEKDQPFVEREKPPKDAYLKEKTWEHVNTDGRADLRYSNNRKLNVFLYAKLFFHFNTFSSSSVSKHFEFMFSALGAGRFLKDQIEDYKNSEFLFPII